MVEHRIPTIDDTPINVKPFRCAHVHKQIIEDQVQQMLKDGVISPYRSSYNSHVFIIPKKATIDGAPKYRMVIDFRSLNYRTIAGAYQLSLINSILDNLRNAAYFSTLDLVSSYNQISICPEDRKKTSFTVSFGKYVFNSMAFGLCNAPATFQRFVDNILLGLQGFKIFAFLDDIFVFGRNLADHNNKIRIVFERLTIARVVL